MHEQTPGLQHPLLTLALILGNIPTYIFLGRIFFKSGRDFFNCVCSINIVNYSLDMYRFRCGWRSPPDREVDALYAVFRLLLFGLGSLTCVVAEYHLITWLLSR
jgi:hypothetical protein